MKKLFIILSLLLVGLADCQGQDKYLQVTTDSVLAFKLAMSDFPVTALPVDSAYNPCTVPFAFGVIGMGVGAGLFTAGLGSILGNSPSVSSEVMFIVVGGGLIISGFIAIISGLTCYAVRKHKHRTN